MGRKRYLDMINDGEKGGDVGFNGGSHILCWRIEGSAYGLLYYNKPILVLRLRAVTAGTEGRAISKSSEKKGWVARRSHLNPMRWRCHIRLYTRHGKPYNNTTHQELIYCIKHNLGDTQKSGYICSIPGSNAVPRRHAQPRHQKQVRKSRGQSDKTSIQNLRLVSRPRE